MIDRQYPDGRDTQRYVKPTYLRDFLNRRGMTYIDIAKNDKIAEKSPEIQNQISTIDLKKPVKVCKYVIRRTMVRWKHTTR